MEGLTTLLSQAHPVDREVLQLWAHPRFTEPARRALYGYRYWPRVTAAVLSSVNKAAAPHHAAFVDRVLRVAEAATRTARVDADLLIGIAAAAMELHDRLGPVAFAATSGDGPLSAAALLETPTMVLRRRARNSPEGLLSGLPGARRRWCITREPDRDDNYIVGDGDVLAPCDGGNHERCEVGIVAGADRLSPQTEHEPFPMIRRACETKVFGRVSLLAAP